jgi:acetolactate synthase-1/2/3 large subunit
VRLGARLGTRFKEADCSSWYRNYTFNIPPTKLIHIDIEPSEIGRNFPTEWAQSPT